MRNSLLVVRRKQSLPFDHFKNYYSSVLGCCTCGRGHSGYVIISGTYWHKINNKYKNYELDGLYLEPFCFN